MDKELDEAEIEVILAALSFADDRLREVYSKDSKWLNGKVQSIAAKLEKQRKEIEHHR